MPPRIATAQTEPPTSPWEGPSARRSPHGSTVEPAGSGAISFRRRRDAAAGLAALLALLSAGAGCSGKPAQGQGPGAVAVQIRTAEAASVDDTTEYVASLKSRASAAIMPQVEGRITDIFVRSGAKVAAGTPLMQIDPAKQQATVQSQEDLRSSRAANLAYAKQQFDRVNGLSAAGIASRQDLDQARAALDAAEADLQSVEARVREQQVELRYYQVTAPFAGIVGDVPVRVGDRVTVSTLLTTVDEPGALEAYVSVPVERAPDLKMRMPVRIVDSTGQVVSESHVTFISPQVDDRTQTVLVKARIDNPERALRPAQFTRARIVWGTREGLLVPVLAVSRIGGHHFAFVAEPKDDGLVARQKPIEVGSIVGSDYFVLDGIAAGDRVIVSGTQFLRDGVPVSPQG